jgi:hypothetical protein
MGGADIAFYVGAPGNPPYARGKQSSPSDAKIKGIHVPPSK